MAFDFPWLIGRRSLLVLILTFQSAASGTNSRAVRMIRISVGIRLILPQASLKLKREQVGVLHGSVLQRHDFVNVFDPQFHLVPGTAQVR